MQTCYSCRAVSASNNARLTAWWNAVLRLIEPSVSQWCGGTRSPSANSVVYQSAPVVDLWCRLFSVGNAVCSPSKVVRRTPAGFFLNPVSHESLDPDDHPVPICFPQLSFMSSLKTNWLLSDLFTQLIQTTTRVTLSQRTPLHWLTVVTSHIKSVVEWLTWLSLKHKLTLHLSSIMTIDL